MIRIKKGNLKLKGDDNELLLDFMQLFDTFRKIKDSWVTTTQFPLFVKEKLLEVKLLMPDFLTMLTQVSKKTKRMDNKI